MHYRKPTRAERNRKRRIRKARLKALLTGEPELVIGTNIRMCSDGKIVIPKTPISRPTYVMWDEGESTEEM